jgi:ribosomal protein S18 acetylase RimI-like enzyme
MAGLIRATRELSTKVFDEDCLAEVTKKSGWKLSLLVSHDLCTLCGFIVSKVAKGALSIAKLAVPLEFRRSGFGKLIMDEVTRSAKKQNDVYEVCLSSLPTAITFYQRLGFKAFRDLRISSGSGSADDLVEGQVYMEKRLRPRRK